MRHIPDGVLRRLVDEPRAVPEHDAAHVQRCRRCQAHRDRVLEDADAARRLLARPQLATDLDRAWARLNRAGDAPIRHVPRRIRSRPLVGATGVVVASSVLVAGVAAAATLTVVFSPTQVAPLPVSRADLQRLTSALGLGGSGLWRTGSVSAAQAKGSPPVAKPAQPSTLPAAAARPRWAYGTIRWTRRPKIETPTSLQAAEAAAGATATLPERLPAGVAGPPRFLAVRQGSATVTFSAAAGPALAGSTLTVAIGPGILAEYGGALDALGGTGGRRQVPTLAIASLQQPTVTSTGATTAQLESFVLERPGFPVALAQEIRLLGDLQKTLPVPVPPGVTDTPTTIAGVKAMVLSVAGGSASGAVWEDHDGTVHTVGGLLDRQDVLDVARQLG